MEGFPSGQREQTVNLSSMTSVVRIHHLPPKQKDIPKGMSFFCFGGRWLWIRKPALRNVPVARFNRRGLPVGRQPLKYLMVAFRRKGIPPPRSQRPLHTEGWADWGRVHEVLAYHLRKNISAGQQNFPKDGSFSCRQKPKKKRGKVSIFACFDNNFQRLKISQIFSQILLTKGDTPAIIYLVAERQAVRRERSMRVCWNW